MDLGFADSTVVVTGGTSGLGLATAQAVTAEGADVIVVGRDRERADAALAMLGDRATAVVADLAAGDAADRIAVAAATARRPVRSVLFSVGGPPPGTVLGVTEDEWRSAFESVVLGPLRVVRSLLDTCPELTSLAWVLSTSAKSPIRGLSISNTLRPGLAMMVKDLADELGPRGTRVNALLPGRFDTPRVAELEASAADPVALRRQLAAAIPLGRYGDPAEFGAVAAFLLSPSASYITGTLLAVDGGVLRAH